MLCLCGSERICQDLNKMGCMSMKRHEPRMCVVANIKKGGNGPGIGCHMEGTEGSCQGLCVCVNECMRQQKKGGHNYVFVLPT